LGQKTVTKTEKKPIQKKNKRKKLKHKFRKKKKQEIEIKGKSDEELISEINNLAPGILSQAKTPEMKKL
jgi:hypothetical protein